MAAHLSGHDCCCDGGPPRCRHYLPEDAETLVVAGVNCATGTVLTTQFPQRWPHRGFQPEVYLHGHSMGLRLLHNCFSFLLDCDDPKFVAKILLRSTSMKLCSASSWQLNFLSTDFDHSLELDLLNWRSDYALGFLFCVVMFSTDSFCLAVLDEFHLCTSAHHQEQMKEIEKLFQTEFDYVEEFRILALRDCQGWWGIRGSVKTGRVWVWKGFIMISRFFEGHLSTSQMSLQIFQVPQPKLVGGLEHEFYFSIQWEFHNPNGLTHSYFFRGVGLNHQPDR